LSSNKLGAKGMKNLSELFPKMKVLQFLDVSRNQIGDEGATWLFNSISKLNNTLKILICSGNEIGNSQLANQMGKAFCEFLPTVGK